MKILQLLKWVVIFNLAQAYAYVPPVGIPIPSFGIDQTHTSYAGKNYVAGGFVYRDGGNGPYSHYIDNSNSTTPCSDLSNLYGTVATPRCTIPLILSAGSVVELHGGPYLAMNISNIVGSESAPIYIRGYSSTNRITFNGINSSALASTIYAKNSSYVIVENLILNGANLSGSKDTPNNVISIKERSSHLAFRHLEVKNYPAPDFCADLGRACWYQALIATNAGPEGINGARVSNIVYYDLNIHNNADAIWPLTYELGRHGIMVESGSEYIWVLESKITRSGDDGIQVYWKPTGNSGPPSHHLYFGRNEIHDMGENAIDVKQSYDVVISQNKLWQFRPTQQTGAGSDGAAVVLNNDQPSSRLWVIYNEIFSSNKGIRADSFGEVHIIGNYIHDIRREAGELPPTIGDPNGVGITTSHSPDLNIVNNTIDSVDGGIAVIPAGTGALLNIANNIISNLNELATTTAFAIAYGSGSFATHHNLLYSANGNTNLKKITCTDNCIIGQDPLYQNQSLKDYRLKVGSPALKAGLSSSSYSRFFKSYNLPLSYNYEGVTNYFLSEENLTIPIDIGSCAGQLFLKSGTPVIKGIQIF